MLEFSIKTELRGAKDTLNFSLPTFDVRTCKLSEINKLENNFYFNQCERKLLADVKNKIASLENEVKKYFSCSKWTCINREVNDFETCLLRSIYRDYGYKLVYKPKMTDGKTFTECYLI